jgi:small subunit ribosomal protein S17
MKEIGMAEQATGAKTQKTDSHRNEKIGHVTSTKMAKTIVVEVVMQKAHAKYKRVIAKSRKFYAHDEQNRARTGDVVRIVETRPLSKLKRWRLAEVIQRAALVPGAENIGQAS